MQASQTLIYEHRNIQRLIKVLKDASEELKAGQKVDPQLFVKSGSFITKYFDQKHHGKEEKIFFALMEDYGFDKDKEPLRTFIIEHDQARAYTRILRQIAFNMGEKDQKSEAELINLIKNFIALLAHHIKNEEQHLFPLADSKFSEDTQKKLTKLFVEFDEDFPEEPLLKKLEELEITTSSQ